MPMATELDGQTQQALQLTREPKAPKRSGDAGTMGDMALMDSVTIIIACWAVLFLLVWSLRSHNV